MIAFNRNKLNQICSHDLCQRMYNKLYKEPCHVSVYYIVFIIYFLRRYVLKMWVSLVKIIILENVFDEIIYIKVNRHNQIYLKT